MTCQELATAVQYNIATVHCVLNNYGWLSIRDLQMDVYGKERGYATEFKMENTGELYSPSFIKLAQAFGCYNEFVEKPDEISQALKNAFESGKPSLIEIPVHYEYPWSEGKTFGWWDMPIPASLQEIAS
jgi:thiamine pyrophosphate-dependent acetolactate synthase large subunit-like protein